MSGWTAEDWCAKADYEGLGYALFEWGLPPTCDDMPDDVQQAVGALLACKDAYHLVHRWMADLVDGET